MRLRRVAQAIDAVLNDQELLRESVDRIVHDFIHNERKHIALENEVVFPAIVDTLQPGDWADIVLRRSWTRPCACQTILRLMPRVSPEQERASADVTIARSPNFDARYRAKVAPLRGSGLGRLFLSSY